MVPECGGVVLSARHGAECDGMVSECGGVC